MNRSRFNNFCNMAILAGGVALGFSPGEAVAGKICPQFLTRYCVVDSAGHEETMMTNPCFAKQRHLRILHRGACKKH